ncbi:MAG TPA: hypothetical protein VIA19_03695, partial [Burkholderiales bacterium]
AGSSWSRPTRIGGETAQRSDLASRGGDLVVVWDENLGERSAVLLARSSDAGASWSRPLRLSSQAADASYPRVVATRWGYSVFWTEAEPAKPARLRIVTTK